MYQAIAAMGKWDNDNNIIGDGREKLNTLTN